MVDRVTIYDNLKERGLNLWDALSSSADEYFSSKPVFSPSQPFDMRYYVDGNYLPPLQDSVQRDVGNAVARGVLDTVTNPVGYVQDLYHGIADPAVSVYENTGASLPYYGNAALQRLRGDDSTESLNIADNYSANAITSLGVLLAGIADVLPSGKVTTPVKGLLGDNVRAVDPMAEKAMAEHLRKNRQASIKKVLTSGKNASPNFFDKEAAEQLALDIRNKQASRGATYRGLLNREGRYLRDDSGKLPYSTQNKLNEFKANKIVNDAAKRLNWNKGLIKDIITEESYYAPDAYRFYVNKKATDATIEAIERAAKKRGWKVAYRSGRATKGGSRYIEVPEKGQIRVSDHELPDTPRRSDTMQNRGYDWVNELIVGNEWKTRTIEDYLNEIESLASQ